MFGAFTALFRGLEQPGTLFLVNDHDPAVDDLEDDGRLAPGPLAQAGIVTIAQMKFAHGDADAAADASFGINAHAGARLAGGLAQQFLEGFDKTGEIRFVEHRAVLGGTFPGEQEIGKLGAGKPALAAIQIRQKLFELLRRGHQGTGCQCISVRG
jgi:hypothetical protein